MKSKFILLFIVTFALGAKAQHDRLISNWSQSQMIYNPAAVATGAYDMSFFANHRSQWLSVPDLGIGMRTNFFNGEFKIKEKGNFSSDNSFGLGFSILSDQTGSANLTTFSFSIPVSYTIGLDKRNKLSIGMSPGFIQQASNRGTQTWENQWNGTNFDPLVNVENSINDSYATMDLGAGVYYQHLLKTKSTFYFGYAVNHLIKPKMAWSFSGDKMYMQMVLQGGADLKTRNKDLKVQPNFLFFKAGNTNSLTAGVTLENTIKEGSKITGINKSTCVNYGVYYRHKDAIVATFGMKVGSLRFGLSFDANTSRLNQATGGVGGAEIYLKALINTKKSNSI
jgi:type IX secretion system PorP/SprF family membrane protein